MTTVLEQKISELGLDPSEAVFHKNAILARAAGRYAESRFSSVVDCWNNFGLLPANCPATPGGIIVAGLFRTVKDMLTFSEIYPTFRLINSIPRTER